jgi:hypothetical protein
MAKTKKSNFLQKHPWDETLVIAVMIAAFICLLILLADYLNASGKATAILPSINKEKVVNTLNAATVVSGSGKMRCNIACFRDGEKTCILARTEDKIAKCNDIIEGNYYCLCASTK